MGSVVTARDLTRTFSVPERDPGLRNALRSLIHRRTRTVRAVEAVSFDIAAGEVVGFLGPNGAGKTTTIKMLAGLLHPTSGTATVLGYTPAERDHDYLRRMSLVMGNRRMLTWDLPVIVYSFFFAMVSLSFRLVDMEALMFRFFQGGQASGRWPIGIFPGWLRVTLTAIVPIGVAVTIPATALTGRLSAAGFALALAAGGAAFLTSRWIFRAGLRHYSGASA